MNAKEEVLKVLETGIEYYKQEIKECLRLYVDPYHPDINFYNHLIDKHQSLIEAVENAIFDVPSEKEIRAEIKRRMLNRNQALHFSRGINYILNYKKPESDGK